MFIIIIIIIIIIQKRHGEFFFILSTFDKHDQAQLSTKFEKIM